MNQRESSANWQPGALSSMRGLADRIHEMEGQATIVEGGNLDQDRAEALTARFQTTRAEEYAEMIRESELLLAHIARETEHREFTYAELEELEQDLGRLNRWADQVRVRDYFGESSAAGVRTLLERCELALETFLERASEEAQPRG